MFDVECSMLNVVFEFNRLRRDFRTIEQTNIRITNIEVYFKEKKERGEGNINLYFAVGISFLVYFSSISVLRFIN